MPEPVIFAVGPEHLKREGLTETIAKREDGQRAPTRRGTFEWWYFDAHFDDQSTAVIVFATKPIISPGDPLRPNLSIAVTRSDGNKTTEFAFLPADSYRASSEMCDVRIGPSWTKQTGFGTCWTYVLHAETPSLAADLTFTGLVPPWRPGAGKSFFGDYDHYFAWLPSVPYGKVEGTLSYDGHTVSVQGTGYHDHNWGNIALPSVMDHWYWGRAHVGDYTLIFVEQIALKKYGSTRMPVLLLAKRDQVLIDDASFLTMQTRDFIRHSSGRSYPSEVDFTWIRGQEQISIRLGAQKMIEATSLLLALSPAKRALARLIANPYYFRFNTELELTIDLSDCKDSVRGQALYEIMLLK